MGMNWANPFGQEINIFMWVKYWNKLGKPIWVGDDVGTILE